MKMSEIFKLPIANMDGGIFSDDMVAGVGFNAACAARDYAVNNHDKLVEENAELKAGIKALNELLIECTVEGELDDRLLRSYMEHSVKKELDQ